MSDVSCLLRQLFLTSVIDAPQLFGHEKVSVLNGGLQMWITDGLPTTQEIPTYQARIHSRYPYTRHVHTCVRVCVRACMRACELCVVRS